MTDASGKVFYADHNTGTTHWDPPAPVQTSSVASTVQGNFHSNSTIISRPSHRASRATTTHIPPQLFVIDMSPTATGELSHMLFELLMQSEIRSSDGRVFHRRPEDVFVIEHTFSESQTVHALGWLVEQVPLSPKESIVNGCVEPRLPEAYHRALYYLQAERNPGEGFARREASDVDCLGQIITQATIVDPTWQQLTCFVSFLSQFLVEYEANDFCGLVAAQDLPGFGQFVVEFLKIGAKDFSLPSLGTGGEASPGGRRGGDGDGDGIDAYQPRRQWEQEEHPYVSFINDGAFDFFGFDVDQHGNHTDPVTHEVKQMMQPELSQTLYRNYDRPLRADYHDGQFWTQEKLRSKLFRIMGLNPTYFDVAVVDFVPYPQDLATPQGKRMDSYILTGDNIKKILAIMFRFKVGIPVALCGHTGCGKTALMQFMCDAMAHQYNPDTNEHTYTNRMIILKVHGGTTKDDIRDKVNEAVAVAETNCQSRGSRDPTLYTVLFFDEVNTCDHQGFIKSLVCDNLLDGQLIDTQGLNLRFVCALNPYQKHTDEMIDRLKHAGLGYSVGSTGTKEKIGGTPMRHLVYRVQQLPKTLRQCVWDFGTLTQDIEDKYIADMGRNALVEYQMKSRQAFDVHGCTAVFSHCLSESQQFMRQQNNECSFVSLRDIERALKMFLWFFDKRVLLELDAAPGAAAPPAAADGTGTIHPITKCIILSLSVCYYFKLEQQRAPYLANLAGWLRTGPAQQGGAAAAAAAASAVASGAPAMPMHPGESYSEFFARGGQTAPAAGGHGVLLLQGPNGADQIQCTIKKCQQLVGKELQPTLPEAVALNDALQENCFLMIVAIETRTPLFLVGKPGSSKSLAKNAVCAAMHGTGSESDLFKKLKHVTAFSYQCSPLSRSEEIKKVFEKAQLFQDQKGDDQSVSVVVLDEIGLAEDSEYMPLKVLHALLEPDEKGNALAFLGISNWALDPAKMNRGIHVNRSAPSQADLVESARVICSRNPRVKPLVSQLAQGYSQLYEEAKGGLHADFFGLRDFYTLIKMLAAQTEDIDAQVLDDVVRRNFDGCDSADGLNQRCGIFHAVVFNQTFATWERLDTNAAGEKAWIPFSTEVSALIEDAKRRGEAMVAIDDERYVDLAAMKQCREDAPHRNRKVRRTEAASGPPQGVHCASPLKLISQSLEETGVAARYLLVISQTDIASSLGLLRSKAGMLDTESSSSCEVIFGSSFPSDSEYHQLCRNINRVKVCMEMGKTVVLLNLRSVMESLYELLNQYFIEYGKGEDKKRLVEIALGKDRVLCSVHADFRLVIIAAEEEVLSTFPIPLLNRLEKHVLSTAGVLEAENNDDANAAVADVKDWARAFVSSQERTAQGLRDAFVGYTDDLIPAIVFHLVQSPSGARLPRAELIDRTKDKLLRLATPDAVLRVADSDIWQQEQEIKEKYFLHQPHHRLRDYVKDLRSTLSTVTTHEQSPVPSLDDIKKEACCRPSQFTAASIAANRLGDFDSEREFDAKVRDFYSDARLRLLIVQCRARDLPLLTNAKYIVQGYASHPVSEDLPADDFEPEPEPEYMQAAGHDHVAGSVDKHVLFLVHLPQKSMAHTYKVAVDGWEPLHMDCVLPPEHLLPRMS